MRVDTRPLRNPPEDTAVRDRMLPSNGLDPQVRDYVLSTPGAEQMVERSLRRALALLALPNQHRVDIHVLCAAAGTESLTGLPEVGRALPVDVGLRQARRLREIEW